MMAIKLDAKSRSALRSAIKAHNGWQDYRRKNGSDLASMTRDELLAAAAALGIDLATIVTPQDNTTQEQDDMNSYTPKPRTVSPERIVELEEQFNRVWRDLDADKAEKARCILATITTKQDGWATEKQFEAIAGIVGARRHVTPPPTVMEAPRHVTPPAPVSGDPASQLAALIAQMAGSAVNPEQVARIVDERINAALASVPSVKIECQTPRGSTVTEGRQHPMFLTLLRACSSRQPDGFAPNVWISGPTGSGKTHAAREVAKALALPFWTHGAMGMPHELMGYKDAGGTYHRTPFREAFEHGGVCLLDECDSWESAVTLALNAGLANGEATFPDGPVKRHQDCIIMAAGNTFGNGATADFVGRNKMDGAFMSRFPVRLAWDYDAELEQHICGNPRFALRVQSARAKARAAGLKVIIDPRASIAGAALIAAGATEQEAAELTYLANLTPEQRKQVEA